jgi:hypothetical protein
VDHFEGPSCCCLLRGTHILAEDGETYVEYLRIGDRLRTLDGSLKPINWIGRRSYSGIFAPGGVRPVHILAGALADNIPAQDLYVSPGLALYIDPHLARAADLVNGTSILSTEDSRPAARIDYYYLDLGGHEVIFAEGAPVESFIEEADREIFHNFREYRALYPEGQPGNSVPCPPRAGSFELAAVRTQLALRASGADSGSAGALEDDDLEEEPEGLLPGHVEPLRDEKPPLPQ